MVVTGIKDKDTRETKVTILGGGNTVVWTGPYFGRQDKRLGRVVVTFDNAYPDKRRVSVELSGKVDALGQAVWEPAFSDAKTFILQHCMAYVAEYGFVKHAAPTVSFEHVNDVLFGKPTTR